MTVYKSIKILLVLQVITFTCAFSQIPVELDQAFKAGDAKNIARFLNQSVELAILEDENIYSQTQAEIVLKDFLKKNAPKSFNIVHEGGKSTSKYAIGTLKTENSSYRVYMLFKTNNGQNLIHQLRIDSDAGY